MGKLITDPNSGKYALIYTLDANEEINMPYYRAFETSSPEGFVRFSLSETEKGRVLVYDLTSLLPLKMVTDNGLNDSSYLDFTKQFLRIVRYCIINKIKFSELILDVNSCYINARTGKLELIYTPVIDVQRPYNIPEFLRQFSCLFAVKNPADCAAMNAVQFIDKNENFTLQQFFMFIENYQTIDESADFGCDKSQSDYLADNNNIDEISQSSDIHIDYESVYLNDTYMPNKPKYAEPPHDKLLDEISPVGEAVGREYIPIQQPKIGYQPPVYQGVQNAPNFYANQRPAIVPNTKCPFLIRVRTGEKYPINVPIVRIGKKAELVDIYISNNNAVSRVHASIFVRGGRYFISDNNSTNFTYIFNNRIPPHTEIEIVPGTDIRIADELFVFRYL